MQKYVTLSTLPTEKLKQKLFGIKDIPTFDQIPKRHYEIDKHLNQMRISSGNDLQRSNYIKVDDDVDVDDLCADIDESKIHVHLAYCK